jgi:hypothetical protein
MSRLRRSLTLIVLLAALLIPTLAAAGPTLQSLNNWADSEHLSVAIDGTGPTDGQFPFTIVDGSDTSLTFFRTNYGSGPVLYEIWYAARVNGVYQAAEPIAPIPAGFNGSNYNGATDFSAVLLSDGNILAVASMSGSGRKFFSSLWDHSAQSWSAWSQIDATAITDEFHLTPTADGAILVFTTDGDANELKVQWFRYNAAAADWGSLNVSSTLNSVSDDYYLSAAYDAVNDTVFVVYPDQDTNLFAGAIFADDTTSAEWTITDNASGYYSEPDLYNIAAFPDGGAVVAYQDDDGVLFTALLSADGPEPSEPVPGFTSPDFQPNVAVDGLGRVVFATRDDNDVIFVNYTSAHPARGGSWQSSALALQTSGTSNAGEANSNLRFEVTPAGYVVAAYFTEMAGDSQQYVNMRVLLTDGWSDEITVDASTAPSPVLYFIMFAVDAQGRPTVSWTSKPSNDWQHVYGANYFDPIAPTAPLGGSPADGRIIPQCLTMPDIEVVQLTPLSAGGSADLRVTMRNQHAEHQGVSDILLSLSDGLSVTGTSANVVNLGQRAALQGLVTAPNTKVSFDVTVSAAADAAPAPLFVAEIYCGGRVLGSVSGPFGGPIAEAAAVSTPAAPAAPVTPVEATPTPAAPPALPVTLPNTAGPVLPLLALTVTAAAALVAGHRLTR